MSAAVRYHFFWKTYSKNTKEWVKNQEPDCKVLEEDLRTFCWCYNHLRLTEFQGLWTMKNPQTDDANWLPGRVSNSECQFQVQHLITTFIQLLFDILIGCWQRMRLARCTSCLELNNHRIILFSSCRLPWISKANITSGISGKKEKLLRSTPYLLDRYFKRTRIKSGIYGSKVKEGKQEGSLNKILAITYMGIWYWVWDSLN